MIFISITEMEYDVVRIKKLSHVRFAFDVVSDVLMISISITEMEYDMVHNQKLNHVGV